MSGSTLLLIYYMYTSTPKAHMTFVHCGQTWSTKVHRPNFRYWKLIFVYTPLACIDHCAPALVLFLSIRRDAGGGLAVSGTEAAHWSFPSTLRRKSWELVLLFSSPWSAVALLMHAE